MGLTPKTREMLFLLGDFFRATDKKFSSAPLEIEVIKADFIDVIRSLASVAKQGRAIYKNLESLERMRYITYKDNCLSFTRKGHDSYQRICQELEDYNRLAEGLKSAKIDFRRKKQAKLRY